jgi:Kef-type K+ transport systems, predicted NAD-binding component
VETSARPRQILYVSAAVVVTLLVGTVGFQLILHETWFQSFYRAVVTATLTGLDSVPPNDAARALSIVLVIAGLTIIAYAGAVIVESIAGGVFTGVLADRRRDRTIKRMRDHFIICGYGRVGRRVAEEFRASGVPYVVLDFSAIAKGGGGRARRPVHRRDRHGGRGSRQGGARARAGSSSRPTPTSTTSTSRCRRARLDLT